VKRLFLEVKRVFLKEKWRRVWEDGVEFKGLTRRFRERLNLLSPTGFVC